MPLGPSDERQARPPIAGRQPRAIKWIAWLRVSLGATLLAAGIGLGAFTIMSDGRATPWDLVAVVPTIVMLCTFVGLWLLRRSKLPRQ